MSVQGQPRNYERQRLWRKRKTEITVETWEETLLRGTTRQVVGRCGQCRGRSLMVTPEEVHQALGVAVRKVWKAVESGEVHSRETAGGDLLVCVESLRVWLKGRALLGPAENEQ